MNNIGQRIKELRKKNDFTQEKLADYLGVTDRAVSKWECGATMPDLALIGPLTKILHVSADELLGLTKEAVDERRAELDENLRQAWINGGESDGFELVYRAEEAIVREYPGDMNILCDFARTIMNRALNSENSEAEMQKAIHHFETVIESTQDEKLKTSAIDGITFSLSYIGRFDEAKQYAALLAEEPIISRNRVLENCLRGEELRKHRQKRLDTTLHTLISLMVICDNDKLQAIRHCEEILRIFFPDGEYLEYHCNLAELAYRKAMIYAQNKNYDEAISALKEYKEHSKHADSADIHKEALRYTSPYFDLLALPPNMQGDRYTPSYIETFYIQIRDEVFDILRDRDDFKELLK